MTTIAFSVPIAPIGKQRARSGNGHHYTPAATVTAEREIRNAFRAAYPRFTPHTGPVELGVVAEFAVPPSWPKWKRLMAHAGLWLHVTKPDASNVLKLVEDALCATHKTMGAVGALYADDSAIFDARCRKEYAQAGRIVVRATLYEQPVRS